MPADDHPTNTMLERLPDLAAGKMPPVDAALAGELAQSLLGGGREAVRALIDALRETDDGSDWKCRFLLQTLVSAAGSDGREEQRRMLAAVLLDEATGGRPVAVRTFLLDRLRWIADEGSVARLLPLLAAAEAGLADAAAAVLVSVGRPARPALTQALASAAGRAKEVIANALAQIEGG